MALSLFAKKQEDCTHEFTETKKRSKTNVFTGVTIITYTEICFRCKAVISTWTEKLE